MIQLKSSGAVATRGGGGGAFAGAAGVSLGCVASHRLSPRVPQGRKPRLWGRVRRGGDHAPTAEAFVN